MLVVLGHQKYLLLVDCVVNCVAFPLLAGGALWPVTILGQNYFLWQILRRKNNLTLYVTIVNLVCDIALVHHDHYLPVSDGALAILNCGTLLLTGSLANLGDRDTRILWTDGCLGLALFVLLTSSVVVSHFCSLLVEHCCSMIVS